jgi:hypothetical protein
MTSENSISGIGRGPGATKRDVGPKDDRPVTRRLRNFANASAKQLPSSDAFQPTQPAGEVRTSASNDCQTGFCYDIRAVGHLAVPPRAEA